MAEELHVINLHKKEETDHPLPYSFLPDPQKCFRLLIFSASNSGKSNVIKNLITRLEFGYSKYYKQNIFLFSPTIHVDPIWQDLSLPKTHLYDERDERIVENILAYASQHNGALLILDDMITSSDAVNGKRGNLLKKIFYQGRHHKVSIILVSQKLKDIPLGMRINSTHIICFDLRNKNEEESFLSENNYIDDLPEKYNKATKEKYNFLYINKENGKAYHNFTKEL
jgi:GTPase SAR1 family protein